MNINSIDSRYKNTDHEEAEIFMKRLEEIFQKESTTNAFAHQLKLAKVLIATTQRLIFIIVASHFCCLRHRALYNKKLKHRTDALSALAQKWVQKFHNLEFMPR
uniref:Uncharacterized protein n=1 Tax=Glossina austeni TaxID=7395 RepID=A0A1A9V3J6_GLOAU